MSGSHEWTNHADWWLDEIREDQAYRLDVLPLLAELTGKPKGRVLDLGCGEGQAMKHVAGPVVGCDVSMDLLRLAAVDAPVVCAELPRLDWLRADAVDAAYMVLVIEHLADLDVFEHAARVVRPGGTLVLVMNHPAFTADGAGPIVDQTDGEVLWRWGRYFEEAACPMATPQASVTFYHRPLDVILNAAAAGGWMLDRIIERGFGEAVLAAHSGYVGQDQMPRLLGVRWMNTQGSRRPRR